MVKTLSSKISDPRPRINVTMTSDDDKTIAQISKGYVNLQRGAKTAILRVPVGEIAGVIDVLQEAQGVLEDNGYNTRDGSDEPMAAPTTRARHTSDQPVETDLEHPSQVADNPFAVAQ